MKKNQNKFTSFLTATVFLSISAVSCFDLGDMREDYKHGADGSSELFFPAVVQVDSGKVMVNKCDTAKGEYQLSYRGEAPVIKKGSVVMIEDNVVLVTDAQTSNEVIDIKGHLGDLSYVFHNVSFTLATDTNEENTKASNEGIVLYPKTVIYGTDTLSFGTQTKGEHSYYGDTFCLWDKTYSETATIYKSDDASITVTPSLSSSMNASFTLEFLDEAETLIDAVAFLRSKQFNFTGRIYGDLTTALNIKADIKKKGSHKGEPTRVVEDLLPKVKLKFQIGALPFWIVMGCDLFAKADMNYSGELHLNQDMSASYKFEEGIKYMPYSHYQVLDKWKRFDVSSSIPAPSVTGKASWEGKVWTYPRFYAEVDYILGPSFEIKPYLKTNIDVAFSEGNSDTNKNYIANTASADIGIEAAVGVSSFLEDLGVNPDSGMYDFGSIAEWNIINSPSSIELISSSSEKVRKGCPITLKYQVNQKNFGDEIASPFFPVVKIEIPKTGEYYYCFTGASGQVEYTRTPKSSDEIINAIIHDASGRIIDQVSFGDGSTPEPTITTGIPHDVNIDSATIPLSWDSESPIIEVGAYYSSTSKSPSLTDNKVVGNTLTQEVTINELSPHTHYYARGYAIIDNGLQNEVIFGNVVEFTTLEDAKPVIELSQEEIDFGSVIVGEKKNQTVSIMNTGAADLIVSISNPEAPYSLNWTKATIAPNSSKTLSITFSPDKAAEYSAAVKLSSNASNGTKYLKVSGKGASSSGDEGGSISAPVIYLSVSSLNFGNVIVGEQSTKNLTISNNGEKSLNISSISCPSGFSASWTSAIIPSGSSKSLNITFSPSQTSSYSGEMTISSDASNGIQSISISGAGVAKPKPVMTLSTTSVDFGKVERFTQTTKSFTIKNTGTGSLEITSISKTRNYGDIFVMSGWTSGGSIAPGELKTISVSFNPIEDRTYNETITIASSNSSTQEVSLTGSGYEEKTEGILDISPSSLDYGQISIGYISKKNLTLKNVGNAPINVKSISINSDDGDESCFSVNWTGGTISAGATESISVSFKPDEAKTYSASLSIKSDAGDGEDTINLSGSAIVDPDTDIKLSKSSINFGNVIVDTRATQSFDITNTGNTTITITSITAPDGFEVTNWTEGYHWSFVQGYSRSVTIEFRPTSIKTYSGNIVVKTSSGIIKNLPISGTGAEAKGYLEITSGKSLDFGNVNIGSSNSLYTKIKNSGDAPISITGIECPDGFSAKCNVSSISAGYNTSVSIVFTPSQVKTYSGTIVLRTDAENESVSINVTGNGKQGSASNTFVDMGLSVKWASANIGASKAEEYGQYIAWAETESKTKYNYNNYKYFDPNSYFSGSGYITKYCNSPTLGYEGHTDPLTMLTYDDDFAQAKLKGLARIPTRKEWEELKSNCNWQWTSRNGNNGYLVTSQINGNSIFLPAAGLMDIYSNEINETGYYWTSNLYTLSEEYAYSFELRSSKASNSHRERYKGLTVRAVEDYVGMPMIYTYTNSISFGGIKLGTSASKSIAISNIGKGTLNISNIETSNRVKVDWTSASIEPGEYKTLTITYTPIEDSNLNINDPETWDFRSVSLITDARNGTGNDKSYILSVTGYGIK